MPNVIAHRGASRAERENTVAAFRRAHDLGATWVELDVRRAADGGLVVHHDPHYPDGRSVAATPSDQRPAHVPLLGTALAACAPLQVNVEIKNSPDEDGYDPTHAVVATTVALIGADGWRDRVLVSCFDRPTLDAVRATGAGLATALLTESVPAERPDRQAWLAGLAADGHCALHPWFPTVDDELIADSHAAGLAVNVWTVDNPELMVRLAAWGVDGICTNVPDVAVAALG
jgi:glycerophosphoryl diester phosphodiesterase